MKQFISINKVFTEFYLHKTTSGWFLGRYFTLQFIDSVFEKNQLKVLRIVLFVGVS